eukprot:2795816-Alexandrium_andersonii.AAC.1
MPAARRACVSWSGVMHDFKTMARSDDHSPIGMRWQMDAVMECSVCLRRQPACSMPKHISKE